MLLTLLSLTSQVHGGTCFVFTCVHTCELMFTYVYRTCVYVNECVGACP